MEGSEMKSRKLLIVAGALLATAATAAIAVGLATGTGSSPGFEYGGSNLTPASVGSFDDYPVYWAGDDGFAGQRLTSINHRLGADSAAPGPAPDYVSVKYGTCESSGSCAVPLEIQTWPACLRNRESRMLVPDLDGPGPKEAVPYPREDIRVRGVPAAIFDNDTTLEVYTGSETVVVFGNTREEVIDAARELDLANGNRAAADLPAPTPAALEGTERC
jgi:hypothetical protein